MKGLYSVLFLAIGVLACMWLAGCAGSVPANGPGALNIAMFSLQAGAANVPYKQLLVASGGVQPYTWSISSGALPAGLSLTTDGVISGTPSSNASQYSTAGCLTTGGAFPITCNFAAQVVDSQVPIHAIDTAGLSITINPDLSLSTVQLGNGVVGEAYAATFSASNGVPPYTYAVAFGNLPPGLTLSTVMPMNNMANSATITGMPTTAGVYSFTVQATDAISETATAVFTITITGRLQGNYAITFNGFDTSQPANSQAFYLVGQLVAANDMNGSGTINGVIDQNGPGATISTNVSVSGTYNIPAASNFGTITFKRSDTNATYTFDLNLSGNATDSKLVQTGPSTQWGAGLLKSQSTTALPGGVSYTFGSFGSDSSGNRFAGAGAFAINPQLTVTGGAEDTNDAGTLSGEQCITSGTFTPPDSSTGRGMATLMLAPLSGGTCGTTPTPNTYVYYVANATELIAVETDSSGPNTVVDMMQQASAGVTGGLVLCKTGSNCQGVLQLDGIGTSGGNAVPEAEVGVASFSGCTGSPCAGSFMRTDSLPPYYVDQSVGGTFSPVTYTGGTYSIDASCGVLTSACGRVTINLTGLTNQPVWYLSTTTQGFVVGGDSDVLQGQLQPQAPPTGGFLVSALLGSYLGGTITPVLSGVTNEIDVAGTPPPGGTWDQNYETSGPGGPQMNLSLMGPYNIDPTYGAGFGRFAICAPNTAGYCTSFTYDANSPPLYIEYIAGGGTVGATGGKAGLVGLNLGKLNQQAGTASTDPNPRLSTLSR